MTIDFKGGRLPNDQSKPRLLFKNYLAAPVAPEKSDWLSEVHDWPMYLNDSIGDCTCAGAGHILQATSTYGKGTEVKLADSDILAAYEAVSGYDPSTGANDNGAVMQDVLSYWRKTGIGDHKILAFAELDIKNIDEVKHALSLFGSLYVGINFPSSAMTQFNNGKPWTVDNRAKVIGGHAIHVGQFDATTWGLITWGAVQQMDQGFWDKYVEEAWVVVTPEWFNENGQTPTGLDLITLGQDVADITGGENPFQNPPTPPVVQSPEDALFTVAQEVVGSLARPRLKKALQDWLLWKSQQSTTK